MLIRNDAKTKNFDFLKTKSLSSLNSIKAWEIFSFGFLYRNLCNINKNIYKETEYMRLYELIVL